MKRALVVSFLSCVLAVAVVVPVVAQKAPKKEAQSPGTIKDILTQYVGKVTSLGTLKKVAADHFVLEDEGDTVMHPLSTVHTIKISKDKESGEIKVEIRLVGKD